MLTLPVGATYRGSLESGTKKVNETTGNEVRSR
jgi:hypothetical protein